MADCPICGKPVTEPAKPFCSKRCSDIDLGRWLKGGYAIPGAPVGPQASRQPPEHQGENDPDGDEA